MGRKPQPRESYAADAQKLLNLARAIRADDKRPHEWRIETAERVSDLAIILIDAPKPNGGSSEQ